MEERGERVRRKARELWLLDGMPEGKAQEHWYKAEDIVRTEDFDAFLANPNPGAEALANCDRLNPDPAARPIEPPPVRSKPKPRARSGAKPARDPLLPPIAPPRRHEAKLQGGLT
ncbi:DUF2934 domain-containing protein [Labrys wisconsinensis]|uniref:DUF2934 domain-containing protein n=1 Tax=Labrys wisconsinensis TaxID=425677 RepID=A0ABU0JGL1_9HYPH|nr:DUF2934 domain-containing protein [Labrys wisconsinensis]MDQ0472606.1 hypothetical protein [Labrys wisconsinensis]